MRELFDLNVQPSCRFKIGCRIRLGDTDCVRPDNRPKILLHVERLQKPYGKPFQFIGAHTHFEATSGTTIEKINNPRKGYAVHRDIFFIKAQEFREVEIERLLIDGIAGCGTAPRDQCPGAMANKTPHLVHGDGPALKP